MSSESTSPLSVCMPSVLCSRPSLTLWCGMLVGTRWHLHMSKLGCQRVNICWGQSLTNGRWELWHKCLPLLSFQWAVLRHVLYCSSGDPSRISPSSHSTDQLKNIPCTGFSSLPVSLPDSWLWFPGITSQIRLPAFKPSPQTLISGRNTGYQNDLDSRYVLQLESPCDSKDFLITGKLLSLFDNTKKSCWCVRRNRSQIKAGNRDYQALWLGLIFKTFTVCFLRSHTVLSCHHGCNTCGR